MAQRETTKHDIQRDEENISTPNFAVVRKIVAGTGIQIGSTGIDSGTGDVNIIATGTPLHTHTSVDIVLQAGSDSSLNPADATTYFIGGIFGAAAGASATIRKIYIPRAGTVTKIYVVFSCVAGTSELSTIYFRLNNTTDTSISGLVALNSTPVVVSNTAMSVAVDAGDFFELKWITPTWATNPTAVSVNAVVYIS